MGFWGAGALSPSHPRLLARVALMACIAPLLVITSGALTAQTGTRTEFEGETYYDYWTYEDAPTWRGVLPAIPKAIAYRISCFPKMSGTFELVIGAEIVPSSDSRSYELVNPPEFLYTPGKDEYSATDGDWDVFSYTGIFEDPNCPKALQVFEFEDVQGDIDRSGGTIYCKAPIQLVRVYIDPVNDAPLAANGDPYVVFTGPEDVLVENSVRDPNRRMDLDYPYALERDVEGSDVDGDTLTFSIAEQPENGIAWMVGDNTFKYAPGPGYVGSDKFVFMVDDSKGGGHNRPGLANDPYLNATATVIVKIGGDVGLPSVFASAEAGREDVTMQGHFWRQNTGAGQILDLIRYRITEDPVPVGGEFVGRGGDVELLCDGREVYDPNNCDAGKSSSRPRKFGWYNFTGQRDLFGTVRFGFTLYPVGKEAEYDPVEPSEVTIVLAPVNDAPDSLLPISEAAPMTPPEGFPRFSNESFAVLEFSAEDADSKELFLLIAPAVNGTSSGYGTLYTALESETDVDPSSAVSLPLSASLPMRCTKIFGARHGCALTLYYVANEQRRGGARNTDPLDMYEYQVTDNQDLSDIAGANVTVACSPGYRMDATDLTMCNMCEGGSFSSALDATECLLCPAGSFSGPAARRCEYCGSGTYNPEEGKSVCIDCPTGATSDTGSKALIECFCDREYYGQNGMECAVCPQPGSAADPRWTNCNHLALRWPLPAFGTFVDATVEPVIVRTCSPLDACPGSDSPADVDKVADGDVCKGGYEGYACAECSKGHYRFDGECRGCPASSSFPGYVAIFALVILLPALLKLVPYFDEIFPFIDAAVLYTQSLAVLSRYSLNWPVSLRDFFVVTSIFNLNLEFLHLECKYSSWDFETRWLVIMLIPPVLVVATMLASGAQLAVVAARSKGDPNHAARLARLGRNTVRGMLLVMHTLYVMVTLGVMEFFDCVHDPRDGNWYLESDPSVQCYAEGTWDDMFPTSITALLVYPVGFILICAGLLAWARNKLSPATPVGRRAGQLMGPFFTRYSTRWFWFELILLARLLVLCGLTAANRGASAGGGIELRQVVINVIVVLVCMLFQIFARPYKSRLLGNMELLAFASNFFTTLCGLFYLNPSTSSGLRSALTALNWVGILGTYGTFGLIIFWKSRDIFHKALSRMVRLSKAGLGALGADLEATSSPTAVSPAGETGGKGRDAAMKLVRAMLNKGGTTALDREVGRMDHGAVKELVDIFTEAQEHHAIAKALDEIEDDYPSFVAHLHPSRRGELIKRLCIAELYAPDPIEKVEEIQALFDEVMEVPKGKEYFAMYSKEKKALARDVDDDDDDDDDDDGGGYGSIAPPLELPGPLPPLAGTEAGTPRRHPSMSGAPVNEETAAAESAATKPASEA